MNASIPIAVGFAAAGLPENRFPVLTQDAVVTGDGIGEFVQVGGKGRKVQGQPPQFA